MRFDQTISDTELVEPSLRCPRCGSRRVLSMGRSSVFPFDYLKICLWCGNGFKEPAWDEARKLGLWRNASEEEIEQAIMEAQRC